MAARRGTFAMRGGAIMDPARAASGSVAEKNIAAIKAAPANLSKGFDTSKATGAQLTKKAGSIADAMRPAPKELRHSDTGLFGTKQATMGMPAMPGSGGMMGGPYGMGGAGTGAGTGGYHMYEDPRTGAMVKSKTKIPGRMGYSGFTPAMPPMPPMPGDPSEYYKTTGRLVRAPDKTFHRSADVGMLPGDDPALLMGRTPRLDTTSRRTPGGFKMFPGGFV